MKIAISGATGFIGKYLGNYLMKRGYEVVAIKRNLFEKENEQSLFNIIDSCHAVINLAGTPINHRWSYDYKKELYESRIFTTRSLVCAINESSQCKLFISTSAIGYYGSEECYDEEDTASKGDDFLSELCYAWEKEAQRVSAKVRLVITRFGVVLAANGGAFERITEPIRKLKMAVILGNGEQSFSWIDRDDLVKAMQFIINRPQLEGILNFTSPEHVTQKVFTKMLSKHFKTWITISIPSFLIKLVYGEASEFILNGQCVVPERLIKEGFEFETPTLKSFLEKLNN